MTVSDSLVFDPTGDWSDLADDIIFDGTVGQFRVQVLGNVAPSNPTETPVQMNLSNFLISSQTKGTFSATLSRTDLAVSAPTVKGIATYGSTFANGTTGSVTFQSWIDANNSGGEAGTTVFDPTLTTTSSNAGSPPEISAPVDLNGNFSLFSKLVFALDGSGSMQANTDLQVVRAAVPEPTTLFLLGTGLFGFVGLTRRRSTAS